MRWLRAPLLVASRFSPFTGASVSPTLEAERDGLTPALGRGLLTFLRHLAGGLSAHVTGGNDRMYGPSEGRELSPSQLHSTASAMPAHGSPTSLGRLARQTCGNKLSRVRAGLRNARPRGISPGNWCRALCREGKQAGREQSRQACYARDGERGSGAAVQAQASNRLSLLRPRHAVRGECGQGSVTDPERTGCVNLPECRR